jgi:uncharacterized protein YuzE
VKVSYDPSGDVLYISLRSTPVEHTEEIQEGMLADYDSQESVIGIEIIGASSRVDNPAELLFAVHQGAPKDLAVSTTAFPA